MRGMANVKSNLRGFDLKLSDAKAVVARSFIPASVAPLNNACRANYGRNVESLSTYHTTFQLFLVFLLRLR